MERWGGRGGQHLNVGRRVWWGNAAGRGGVGGWAALDKGSSGRLGKQEGTGIFVQTGQYGAFVVATRHKVGVARFLSRGRIVPFGGIGVVIMPSRMRVAITILNAVRPHAASMAWHHPRGRSGPP